MGKVQSYVQGLMLLILTHPSRYYILSLFFSFCFLFIHPFIYFKSWRKRCVDNIHNPVNTNGNVAAAVIYIIIL